MMDNEQSRNFWNHENSQHKWILKDMNWYLIFVLYGFHRGSVRQNVTYVIVHA